MTALILIFENHREKYLQVIFLDSLFLIVGS